MPPEKVSMFDFTRHITRGDIIRVIPGAHIIVKRTKTVQRRDTYQVIQIPNLTNGTLCPVKANHLLHNHSGGSNAPIFSIPGTVTPITQPQIRTALVSILGYL